MKAAQLLELHKEMICNETDGASIYSDLVNLSIGGSDPVYDKTRKILRSATTEYAKVYRRMSTLSRLLSDLQDAED
jgi:hypothetical protein